MGVLPVCDATLDTLLRRSLDVSHEVRGRDVDWLVGGGKRQGRTPDTRKVIGPGLWGLRQGGGT